MLGTRPFPIHGNDYAVFGSPTALIPSTFPPEKVESFGSDVTLKRWGDRKSISGVG
jgi:hypothetical protein